MKRTTRCMAVMIAALTLFAVQSCKEKTDPFDDNVYLVSADREVTMTKANILTLLSVASALYPDVTQITDDVTGGVIVYSVTYNTTFKGNDVLASGLIAVPSEAGSYPVLAYQNGTNTLYANAPSVNPYYTLYQLLECAASTGYVVIITDYLGFGVSEDIAHPYLHKESTVQTVIDMLYALREFDEDVAKDITVLNEHYLMGYSQGGWATLALLETMEQDYAADFDLAGCTCGAGSYDVSYFNSWLLGQTEYPMPSFIGYISNAYSTHGLFTNPLGDIFNEPYATRIAELYDGTRSTEQINDQLTKTISQLFKPEYVSGYASAPAYQSVRDAMTANSVDGWDSNVPLLFTHGTADTYVPPVLSQRIYNAMITAGTSVASCAYVPLEGLDHSAGIVPAGLAGLAFFKSLR
jgi:pimeloyl-ACP methyl ester carboxylesterase